MSLCSLGITGALAARDPSLIFLGNLQSTVGYFGNLILVSTFASSAGSGASLWAVWPAYGVLRQGQWPPLTSPVQVGLGTSAPV